MKRLTTEEFIEKARKVHGDKFDYSEVEYVSAHTKVKIKCNKCSKVFEQSPNTHLSGYGCPNCVGRNRNKEDFIKLANKVHGEDTYDYSEVEYINTKNKIKIKCNKCGNIFLQRLDHHLNGSGCTNCLYQKRRAKDFVEKAQKIHGKDRYNYINVVYKNRASKVEIFCNNCKKFFWQYANTHLQGKGCPNCYPHSKGEVKIKEFLDLNKIIYKSEHRFKDCRDKNPLPFDFYLPDYNICIEFQGQQHFKEGINFYTLRIKNKNKSLELFEKQQLHDQIKRDYCKANNITLIEIKYNEDIEEKLSNLLLLKK